MKITKKIFNKVLFASVVAIVFALFNRCSVKAQVLEYTIPNTKSTFSYDLDTQQYPYYVGIMRANSSTEFGIELIFSDQSFYYDGVQKDNCGAGSSTYCYGWVKKRSGSIAKIVYIVYDVETNNIIRSNLDSPSDITNDLISLYNYSDFISYVDSYYEMSNGYPFLDGPVGWILSNDLETSGGTTVLTKDYINSFSGTDIFDIDFSVILSSDNSNKEFNDDNHITGAGIAVNYFPKDNSEYNYYYYWEPLENFDDVKGPPSNYDKWVKLEDSDRGIGALSVHSNGYVYAIITDKNNTLLSSSSLKFDKFGSISLIPVNNNKISTYLTKISDRINYGGPISSILTIPINFISNIYNSFNGTCRSFNLGALLGTNIVFPCFTLESILGSSITNIIDMLCSFFIYYHLILFIISIYRKIMNLDDLDDYMPQHLYHPKHGSYEDYNS